MNVRIRRAMDSDREQILRGIKETAWQDLTPDQQEVYSREEVEAQIQHLFDRLMSMADLDHEVLVAEIGTGEYAGHIWLGEITDAYTGARRGYVYDLFVSPAYRGRGIASLLLDHAEEVARRRGHREIGLTVAAHNGPARRLYAQAGFRVERLLMSKTIRSE